MGELRNLPQTEWKGFFDSMSDALLGRSVEIEVASLELGDQIVADRIPMIGITYDSHDDMLDIGLDRINHLIRHPRQILVEEGSTGLLSVAVVDGEDTRQVIRLKDPLKLSAAGSAGTHASRDTAARTRQAR